MPLNEQKKNSILTHSLIEELLFEQALGEYFNAASLNAGQAKSKIHIDQQELFDLKLIDDYPIQAGAKPSLRTRILYLTYHLIIV